MKLPNGDRAEIPDAKLLECCLDPQHTSGRHKARVFKSVLGIDRSNADLLKDILRTAAPESDVTSRRESRTGIMYVIETPLTGTQRRLRSA